MNAYVLDILPNLNNFTNYLIQLSYFIQSDQSAYGTKSDMKRPRYKNNKIKRLDPGSQILTCLTLSI